MAFDRTDPADLLALKTEVNTDPIGMGYAAVVANTAQLLKLLNDTDANVGDGTPGQETQVARVFDVLAMLDALDPTEYEAQQTVAGAPNYVHTLVEVGARFDISAYKTKFRSLFATNSNTVAALDAQVQAISRAEALFGVETVISRDDWIAARDS
jgi:hypothetical protein